MTIRIERIDPIEKAFERLRNAPLEVSNGEHILIYQNATMRLSEFFPDELNPTSLYVLQNQLHLLRKIREELIDTYQIDILRLSSVLHLRTDSGHLLGMAPPFVEFYQENVEIIPLLGDNLPPSKLSLKIPILKDGIHRAWIAREEKTTIRCAVVHGALQNYPPYAYPNQWHQVQVYDAPPPLKKFYRRKNPYSFLRPLKVLRQTGDMPPPSEWGRQ